MADLQNQNVQEFVDRWRNASISNRFMFRLVMEDKELCRETLELLLGFEIVELEYLEGEKSFEAKLSSKGIRLDVYIKDKHGNIYDLEMQAANADHAELGLRTRYYQSLMDADQLKKGMRYGLLPRSIVIFICKYDPFELNYPRYNFSNRCAENTKLELGDNTLKLFINTTGDKQGLSESVVNFMEYINTGVARDDFTERLEMAVQHWRQDEEKAVAYMTYEQEQMEAEARGEKRGRAEGRAEGKIEGRAEEKISIAENLIRSNIPAEVITKSTELSLEKLKEIAGKIGVELVMN